MAPNGPIDAAPHRGGGGSGAFPDKLAKAAIFALNIRATCATGAPTHGGGCPGTWAARPHAFASRKSHLALETTRCLLLAVARPVGLI